MTFAETLTVLKLNSGMTARELSAKSGISEVSLSGYLKKAEFLMLSLLKNYQKH